MYKALRFVWATGISKRFFWVWLLHYNMVIEVVIRVIVNLVFNKTSYIFYKSGGAKSQKKPLTSLTNQPVKISKWSMRKGPFNFNLYTSLTIKTYNHPFLKNFPVTHSVITGKIRLVEAYSCSNFLNSNRRTLLNDFPCENLGY